MRDPSALKLWKVCKTACFRLEILSNSLSRYKVIQQAVYTKPEVKTDRTESEVTAGIVIDFN